ncbi:protein FAR-RED IMPAIRED RESPONSE 1-like isoform X2 [Olea europaea var. sylvestris]|uniref:protein FAR-RED IMPAIRED RESPONSE 1-like isoform X2 n=1 Tax=Olea europaea var. sylvestris TaxID=158386 RepID=UPI000C1D2BBB|nr:protein FAR-RED IMPAIRED RESPONSE 1-like isoform X2 [Olea europaea var. sylvestris]
MNLGKRNEKWFFPMIIDLGLPSGNDRKDKDNEPDVYICMNDARIEGQNGDGTTFSAPSIFVHDKEQVGPDVISGSSNSKQKVPNRDELAIDFYTYLEPHDDMEFQSKEDAFSFYKEYAKSVGFSTITKASRRSRISGKFIDAKFVCTRYGSKQGPSSSENSEPMPIADVTKSIPVKKKRGRTNRSWFKTDCKACMHVKRRQDGRWIVHSFVREHNHEVFSEQANYLESQRNMNFYENNINATHGIRAKTKNPYMSISRESSGMKKTENQKSSIASSGGSHLDFGDGDAQVMVEFLLHMQDKNPNFFYAIDLNQDRRLKNVFWVDAKSRLDYESFGDVVFFDTTYKKNESKLPFVPFIGMNNHFQLLLLGCGLLGDQTKSTYGWLIQAWLRAMHGQAPKVILTDQDQKLKEAIAEVLPHSRHCFCLWHILSKIQEKLAYVMRQHENFMSEFSKCILKSQSEEHFEYSWWKVVDTFDLKKDTWIQSLYDDRLRWVPTFMKNIFLAGLSTKQRLESISSLDKCLLRKTRLNAFLHQYKTMLLEKYEDEAKADIETWSKPPGLISPSPYGKQMATRYTHAVFKKFQVEVLGVVACHPKLESEDGLTATFKVQDFEENQDYSVTWNEKTSDVSCTCHLFEYNGFLCRHVMIVLQISGVHSIPDKYILKRWTKDAKSRETMRQLDLGDSRFQLYNDICQRALKLGDEGSISPESYNIAFVAMEKALLKCKSINNSVQGPSSPSDHNLHVFEDVTHGNCKSKTKIKSNIFGKGKVHPEQETLTKGINDGWDKMGYSNFQAPALDCSYGLQESIPGTGQLNSRVSAPGGLCGSKEIVHRAEQMNTFASSSNYYYSNQRSIHGILLVFLNKDCMAWGNCISDPITFRIVFSPRITCRSSTLKSLKGSDIHYFCISIAVHGRSSIFDHLVLRRTDNLGTGQVETNEA